MRILFFDLATCTGWAAGDHGANQPGPIGIGHFRLPKTGPQLAPFLFEANSRIAELVDQWKPELVAFEQPLLLSKTTITTLRKLYGLAGECEKVAFKRKLECREANLSDIRTHFLGRGYPRNGKLAKRAVCARCKALGWTILVDDEGDACAGLDFMLAITRPGHALRVTPMFEEKKGLPF